MPRRTEHRGATPGRRIAVSGGHRAHREPPTPRGQHRAVRPGRRREQRRRTRAVAVGVAIGITAVASIGGVFAAVRDPEPSTRQHATDGAPRLTSPVPTAASTDVAATQAADIEPDAGRGSSTGLNANVPPAGDGTAKLIVPKRGSGRFAVAPGASVAAGRGTLVTYSVEIESELDMPLARVARLVDETLADRRGWTTAAGRILRRVSADPMIRIRIATPETTDRLCAPLDTGGRLSCRNGENVVLNAWRWANGAGGYEGNLADYRRYMINHEVGHALGFDHASCPSPGAIAPAMLQQTKGLDGCTPNPWPAIGGAR